MVCCIISLGAPCEMRRAFFLLGKNFKVTVLAPTGIAASINAGCKTIHSVLAIPVPLPAEYVPLSRADIVRLRSDVGKTCKLIVLFRCAFTCVTVCRCLCLSVFRCV